MNAIEHLSTGIVPALFAASIRASILIFAAWVITLLMHRSSSAARHLLWTFAMAGVLLLPLLPGILPKWPVAVLPARAVNLNATTNGMSTENTSATSAMPHEIKMTVPIHSSHAPRIEHGENTSLIPEAPKYVAAPTPAVPIIQYPVYDCIFLIWSIGVIFLGMFRAIGSLALWRISQRASAMHDGPIWKMLEDLRKQLGITRRISLLLGHSGAMPMAWGIWRPKILLPGDATTWPQDRMRSVLLHELAHVRRWDAASQWLALFALILHWFNPLIWLAGKRMRLERERACDDIVIDRGLPAAAYAEDLVLLARNFKNGKLQNVAAVAMARRSGLADRVGAILNANINRQQVHGRARLIVMIAIVAVLVPLSAIHLLERSANVARAANAATTAAAPTNSDEHLPPLPDRLPSNYVPIQVLSPQGIPLRIDAISHLLVWINPDSPWSESWEPPKILAKHSDGWVLVDKMNFILAHAGEQVDMTFSTSGTSMTVSGAYPKAAVRKLIFHALYNPSEIGVDTSAGPAGAQDEVAGEVVDPDGKPVAGAVASFPVAYGKPPAAEVITGADGIFRFPHFANQWYVYLQVEKTGYAPRLLTDLPIGHGFLVHLDDHTRLQGILLGPDGSIAANAKFEITTSKPTSRPRMFSPIPDMTVSAQADARGHYDVPLEPGKYEVRITASNGAGYFHFDLPSGQTVSLPGELQAGAHLKLVAIDTITNKPAAGVHYYVAVMRPGSELPLKESERTTGNDGVAEWSMLTPGPTNVSVNSSAYARWWTDQMPREPWMRGIDPLHFNLTEKMPTVTVHVEPAVQASGRVVSPDGKPVAYAFVDIAGLHTGDSRYARPTDAAGNFHLSFPVLQTNPENRDTPVRYALVASDHEHRWANAASAWFTPKIGQKLVMNLQMTPGVWVRGRVVNSDAKPIAHLEVQGQNDDQLDRMYYNPRTLTDASGNFLLGPMRPGQYAIYFYAQLGQVTGRSDPAPIVHVAPGDHLDVGDIKYDGPAPSPIPPWYKSQYLAAPAPPADINWRHITIAPVAEAAPQQPTGPQGPNAAEAELVGTPAKPGDLSGKVSDEQGRPLSGVSIYVSDLDGDPDTSTDSNGQFHLHGLDIYQKVQIRFSHPAYDPKYIPQQPTGLSGLAVTLSNKTYFQGVVKDPAGHALAHALIRADQGPKQCDGYFMPSVWTQTTSDSDGHYRLYVQPDSYDIQVRDPAVGVVRTGKTPIAAGQVRHLDLTLIAGITFHAKVVDSITGKSVAGVHLSSWDHKGIEGHSDQAGNIVIPDMISGRFEFDVDAKGYARWWSAQALSEWNRRKVEPNKFQRNFDNLDFDIEPQMPETMIVVERAVTIRGRVLDPNGQAVAGATVAPALTGTGNSLTGDTRFSVRSNADGSFLMTLPASGGHDYNLVAHDGDLDQWRHWSNGVLPPFRTHPGQELDNITIILTRPAEVSGRLVDADGHPIAHREVRTAAADLMENRYYDPTVRTDKNGNFTLKFVRSASQFIQAAPFSLNPTEAPPGSTQKVLLKPGQVLANIRLTAAAD